MSADGLTQQVPEELARHRKVLEELGGSWHDVTGDDVPATLVAFATAQRATQIVLGTSRRSRWTELTKGSIINRVVRDAKGIDVHVIATADGAGVKAPKHPTPIASAYPRRRLASRSASPRSPCSCSARWSRATRRSLRGTPTD